MTFGEKLKAARLAQNLSQKELSKKTGISERSLYTYEQASILPRGGNIQKLADALNISVTYLLDENEHNTQKNINHDTFLPHIQGKYGHRGINEVKDILSKASALFAGGELDEKTKDIFFQSLMELYLDSKEEARAKFSSNKRVRRTKK